ncbi:MAG: DUF3015 family protein [Betaproteobacteria bacterium]|nr:DUF3015 family protein [Betaproteobacteria bacterium]
MTCKLLSAGVLTAVLASAGVASAQVGSGPNPFSDCGVGAALFPETKWAAVTSNIIWDIGTTAVISATASPETCNGKKVAAAVFITNTYDTLAEQAAAGKGEHLASVLNILECSTARHDAAIANIRTAMAQKVSAPTYAKQPRLEKAAAMYGVVEAAVGSSCTA